MSASARAEARRKAILSRGTDRLAKLTTSARGEDAPAFMNDVSSQAAHSRNFIGEDSGNMPVPKPFTPSSSPSPQPKRMTSTPPHRTDAFEGAAFGHSPAPDPSVWSPEQQQQFMQALLGASAFPSGETPLQSPLGDPTAPIDLSLPPMDNPLAAMLFPQGGSGNGAFPPFSGAGVRGKSPASDSPMKEPTRLQKLMPLIHMLSMWCLLAYFVIWLEPKLHDELGGSIEDAGLWRRWAELATESSVMETASKVFRIQVVPFFWAFTTIQIVLHSLRIFSGFDVVRPPAVLAFALPHLPPPFPSIVLNSLKYVQMGSVFLDDLAGLVVGIGFIIYFTGLFNK